MDTKKTMIAPFARDAPNFSSKQPLELKRFIREMEDIWNDVGIMDDEEKKRLIGKYADFESEEEWQTLETYQRGYTWLEFKAELVENYPEVAAAERGTPARIRQLCQEWKEISLGDLEALYAFLRSFRAEAKKLMRPPAVMSNRELVQLFVGSLSEPMALAVLQFLGSSGEERRAQRRPEDPYDLAEVFKAAVVVSEDAEQMFYLINKTFPESVNERVLAPTLPTSNTNDMAQRIEDGSILCRVWWSSY